jgi:hypothetical protein
MITVNVRGTNFEAKVPNLESLACIDITDFYDGPVFIDWWDGKVFLGTSQCPSDLGPLEPGNQLKATLSKPVRKPLQQHATPASSVTTRSRSAS